MKKLFIIALVSIIIASFTTSCYNPKSVRIVKYHMELKLIDGTIVSDTFELCDDCTFKICVIDGAYALCVEEYGYIKSLRGAVIDYKVIDVTE